MYLLKAIHSTFTCSSASLFSPLYAFLTSTYNVTLYLPVMFSSVSQSCATLCYPWTAARQAPLSIINSWSLLKLMSVDSVMPSNHLIICHPLFLLPSIFPRFRVFSNESVLCIKWPKYWSFSISISPCNEYSRLVSSRMDRLDRIPIQGIFKSLLQHHS